MISLATWHIQGVRVSNEILLEKYIKLDEKYFIHTLMILHIFNEF